MDKIRLTEALFETMKNFSNTAIDKSGMPRIVRATVTSLDPQDPSHYKVAYMQNVIDAYAISTPGGGQSVVFRESEGMGVMAVTGGAAGAYAIGSEVYVLIPEGDFSDTKLILCGVPHVDEGSRITTSYK